MHIVAETIVAVWAGVALWWLGYQFAVLDLEDERERLEQEKAVLVVQRYGLDQTRRIQAVVSATHRVMHAEAAHHLRPTTAMSGEQESRSE